MEQEQGEKQGFWARVLPADWLKVAAIVFLGVAAWVKGDARIGRLEELWQMQAATNVEIRKEQANNNVEVRKDIREVRDEFRVEIRALRQDLAPRGRPM